LSEPELILQNDKILVFQKQLGQYENLNHLVVCRSTNQSCVIDPFDGSYWLNFCVKNNFILSEVWLTHSHYDHIKGVDKLYDELRDKLIVRCHEFEQRRGYDENYVNWWKHPEFTKVDCFIGEAKFSAHCTPGHTPGHITFIGCGAILTGDCLFLGSCGRTDLYGGNPNKQRQSLQYLAEVFKTCSNQDLVLPGHRYPLEDDTNPMYLRFDKFISTNLAMNAINDNEKWTNLPFLSFDDDLARKAKGKQN